MTQLPSVYQDGDIMVVRASSLGSCARALAAYGRYEEVIPIQRQELLDRTAKEGNLHESTVVDHLIEQGYDVADSQATVTLSVIKGRVEVRGHIDGIHSGEGVVEIKSMSKSRFDDWQRKGLGAFPRYQWQLSAYMYGLADQLGGPVRPALYAVKRRDDGLIDTKIIDFPPINFQAIRKKLVQVYQHRKDKTLPDCDLPKSEQFWCPFPFLHNEDVDEMDLPDDKVLALEELVIEYDELRAIEKAGKDATDKKRALGKKILDLMDGRDKATLANHTITRVQQMREMVDTALLKAELDPAELARFQKLSPVEYPLVKRRKK